MQDFATMIEVREPRQAWGDETLGLLFGAGFTLALFFAVAHFENLGTSMRRVETEDLHVFAVPFEPPPPTPRLEEPAPPEVLPLSGLELGATDSPVAIAVVPPDLEAHIPAEQIPARAKLQLGVLHTDLKPRADIEVDARHVYQEAEVDQRPRALVRSTPSVPVEVRGNASTLRVNLILLIGVNGRPESARVAESSGNPRFDAIVVQTVLNEWLFSPAIRRGQRVRVLAEQAFRVNFSTGSSPFDVN